MNLKDTAILDEMAEEAEDDPVISYLESGDIKAREKQQLKQLKIQQRKHFDKTNRVNTYLDDPEEEDVIKKMKAGVLNKYDDVDSTFNKMKERLVVGGQTKLQRINEVEQGTKVTGDKVEMGGSNFYSALLQRDFFKPKKSKGEAASSFKQKLLKKRKAPSAPIEDEGGDEEVVIARPVAKVSKKAVETSVESTAHGSSVVFSKHKARAAMKNKHFRAGF
mmetsp:Transcript_12936/g.20042  ORF Transcript_12936/g.20042 Transcript_12936/m.20042 type:complete len:220 (+) Transcript_12936:94-753(+)